MMNMMYTTGVHSGLLFFLGVHIVSMVALGVGVLFLLFWAYKKLSADTLWKWGWILSIIGVVACLLTMPLLFAFGPFGHPGYGLQGFSRGSMMGGVWQSNDSGEKSADQLKEEADGKALYDKLVSKEVTCADLSDDDFELIGEYVMGLRTGANHEQMNDRIKVMMGDEGEVQMHTVLGKSAVNCTSDTDTPLPFGGMMNGAGMMGGFSSASTK